MELLLLLLLKLTAYELTLLLLLLLALVDDLPGPDAGLPHRLADTRAGRGLRLLPSRPVRWRIDRRDEGRGNGRDDGRGEGDGLPGGERAEGTSYRGPARRVLSLLLELLLLEARGPRGTSRTTSTGNESTLFDYWRRDGRREERRRTERRGEAAPTAATMVSVMMAAMLVLFRVGSGQQEDSGRCYKEDQWRYHADAAPASYTHTPIYAPTWCGLVYLINAQITITSSNFSIMGSSESAVRSKAECQ